MGTYCWWAEDSLLDRAQSLASAAECLIVNAVHIGTFERLHSVATTAIVVFSCD